MDTEKIAQMAGTDKFKGGHVGGSYVDTITLGKDGKFYKAFYSQPKDKREDPKNLGTSIKVTLLKIRGKLTRWEENQQTLESVEYDAGTDLIATTKGDMSEQTAKGLGAKKALIVYALHDGGLVKLTVSGGSLYSPAPEEGDEDYDEKMKVHLKTLRLYSYLQSFEGDEHTFMVETEMKALLNEYEWDGEKKTNYHMTFSAGKESDIEAVGKALEQLVEELIDNDARDLKFLGFEKKAEADYKGDSAEGGEAVEETAEGEKPPF